MLLRFAAPFLVGLSMTTAFCHLLELPARLSWDAPLWIQATVTGGIFRMFGTLGAALEVGAILIALAFTIALRRRHPAFGLALLGSVLLLVMHAAFWIWIAPVNAEIATWTPGSFPADWSSWRAQWEWTHAARALLEVAAFAAILGASVARSSSAPALHHTRRVALSEAHPHPVR